MTKLGEVTIKAKDTYYAREMALDAFADNRPNYTKFRTKKLRDLKNGDMVYGVYAVKKKKPYGY